MGSSNCTTVAQSQSTPRQVSVKEIKDQQKVSERSDKVIKEFIIRQEDEEVFKGMIQRYQGIKLGHVVQLEHVSRVPSIQQFICYELTFTNYTHTLRHLLYDRQFEPFGQDQILNMISQVSKGLFELTQLKIPIDTLSPARIMYDPETKQYLLGAEILSSHTSSQCDSNHSLYSPPPYLQPSQNNRQLSAVYSVAMLALRMTKGEELSHKAIERDLFNLKPRFSRQFCLLLSDILVPSSLLLTVRIDQVIKKTTIMLENGTKPPTDFIPGYNTLESSYLLQSFLPHPCLLTP